MAWRIAGTVSEILQQAEDAAGIDRASAKTLLQLDPLSREGYALMETANRLSRMTFKNKGESHFHIGVNVEPCPMDCRFCSLTRGAGIFTERMEFSPDRILAWARMAESHSADALNLMTTGTYSFERLLELGRMLKAAVSTPLVANTRDIDHEEGERLLAAGFVGFYHAVRLGEGKDTPFRRERRIRTIQVLRDVGLRWMNCVEPLGPEHSHEEIIELMFLAREYRATYSGVMRRINFPGSPMGRYGMVSEPELAKVTAVSRLVMGDVPSAHCTHEPNTTSLIAGANLLFPEVGSSPRDDRPDSSEGIAKDADACRKMLEGMGWIQSLPSNCFGARPDHRVRAAQKCREVCRKPAADQTVI